MKIAERTAEWRRERRVLLRVSRAAWRLEQAGRERSRALASGWPSPEDPGGDDDADWTAASRSRAGYPMR